MMSRNMLDLVLDDNAQMTEEDIHYFADVIRGECPCCKEKQARISALEAERGKAVELLRGLIKCCTHCETYRMLGYLSHCEKCQDVQSFLASIGGEGKSLEKDDAD